MDITGMKKYMTLFFGMIVHVNKYVFTFEAHIQEKYHNVTRKVLDERQ